MEISIIFVLLSVGIVYYINKNSIKSIFKKVKSKEDYNKKSSDSYGKTYERFKNNYEKYSSNTNNYGSDYYGSSQSSGSDKVIDLISDIKKDFNKAPFRDKFILNDSSIFIGYNFEQGRIIKIKYDLVVMDFNGMSKTTYKLSTSVANTLLQFFTQLSSQARSRFTTTNTDTNVKYTDEQLKYQETFWKLKKINDLRMEQLNKMSKTSPDRPALVNELNVVKGKMKAAYLKSGLKKETTKK